MHSLLQPLSPNESRAVTACRALAVLPIGGATGRAAAAESLTALASSDGNGPHALVRNGGVQALCFLARVAFGLPRAREGLVILSERNRWTAEVVRRELERNTALQLELACGSMEEHQLLRFLGKRDTVDDDLATGLLQVSIRDALDAAQGLYKGNRRGAQEDKDVKGYTLGEIDALFYEATVEDIDRYKPLWSPSKPASNASAGVAEENSFSAPFAEDYFVELQTRKGPAGGIATLIANAIAMNPSVSDDVIYLADGILALRKLLRYPPDSANYRPAKLALLRAEIARAVANLAAGTYDIRRTAHAVVSSGFAPLFSQWAADPKPARGHLQAESFRALHNLSNALRISSIPDESRAGLGSIIEDERAKHKHTQPVCSVNNVSKLPYYADRLIPLQHPCVHFNVPRKDLPVIDVIFVHGLRGSPLLTWRTEGRLPRLKDIDVDITVWPRDWLVSDAPRARLLSVGYDASILDISLRSSSLNPRTNLEGRASAIQSLLTRAQVGQKGIVFVAHSYGGLIVKQMLWGPENANARLADNTIGIVFFSTPHRGSPLARQGRIGVSKAVRELLPGESSPLLALNDKFVREATLRNARAARDENTFPCEVISIGEGKKTQLASQWKVALVPPESSDPGVGRFILYEGTDHLQICKPSGRWDGRYRYVKELVGRAERYCDKDVRQRRFSEAS